MGRILLVNDDGPTSSGLALAYSALSELGEVTIVVPELPKSGGGHSLTLHKPLFIRRIRINGIEAYVVNGTPVDCVHMGVQVLKVDPVLVVSGVNIGENTSAQNLLYSGTVGAAVEAGLFGIPAIAISADVRTDEEFLDPRYSRLIRTVVLSLARYIMEFGWFEGVDALSVNIPRTSKPVGVKIAKTQRLRFAQFFEKRVDPRGREYYWLVGKRITQEGSDSYYLEKGYVIVTPLKSDITHPAISGCPELPAKFSDFMEYLDEVVSNYLRKGVR